MARAIRNPQPHSAAVLKPLRASGEHSAFPGVDASASPGPKRRTHHYLILTARRGCVPSDGYGKAAPGCAILSHSFCPGATLWRRHTLALTSARGDVRLSAVLVARRVVQRRQEQVEARLERRPRAAIERGEARLGGATVLESANAPGCKEEVSGAGAEPAGRRGAEGLAPGHGILLACSARRQVCRARPRHDHQPNPLLNL